MVLRPSIILPPYFSRSHYKKARSALFEDKPEGFTTLKPWNPHYDFDFYQEQLVAVTEVSGLGSAPE
ncbi:hypothetical protein CXB51_036076 [Gossypium anomalum]|uniref:Uncharacterized protein n=1 Tax=Gossypium anomalum TaxID=47600 RepID=A0A8J6CE66_9ROSI|nr:hypothetical protein CXB51_036076 [Gossypium anomalum]